MPGSFLHRWPRAASVPAAGLATGLSVLLGLVLMILTGLQRADAAARTVVNVTSRAELRYVDGRPGADKSLQSNTVVATGQVMPPSIRFFTDSGYRTRAWTRTPGQRLFLQIEAASCNLNPNAADSISFTLHSWKAGDIRHYTAVETAPNSGRFTLDAGIMTRDQDTPGAIPGGVWHGVLRGDTVEASFPVCGGGGWLSTTLLIDPGGVVFDAATGAPVAGATVDLIDVTGAGNGGAAGGPARVLAADGISDAPSEVVTAADGRYVFPLVQPSQYRLSVKPPVTHRFPSTLDAARLPQSFDVSAPGSYGGGFPVNAATGTVALDLPLDPVPHGLSVTKTASRTSAEIAETVEYLVTVKNVGDLGLSAVGLSDSLPAGFAYLPGSARLDGAAIADPSGGRGPALGFAIGDIAAGSGKLLRYRVRLGTGALNGDGVNRAQAHADVPLATLSNVASVKVKVEPGVFSDKAIVLGTVFADCNGNGVKDADEPGAPGVRLVMEDGSFVVTDGQGRYSFYGIGPRTHVLKIDATSLPEGAETVAISHRHAGDGNSRFVDAHRGELERADFALRGCSPALTRALAARRAAQGERELSTSLKTELKTGPATALGDVRALPAQGLVGDLGTAAPAVPPSPAPVGTAPSSAAPLAAAVEASWPATPSAAAARPARVDLEALAGTLDNQLGFIDLQEGQVVGSLPQSIRVKGRAGATIRLQVDGVAVGDDRLGQRAVAGERQAELREYVGVRLHRGENLLQVSEADPFGNVRGTVSLHVRVPGELARIVVTPASERADADGQGRVAVRVELQDAGGLAVVERTPVTLDTSLGQWDALDLDSRQPGVQTFVEGGAASFGLMAPPAPGEAELRVTAAAVGGRSRIAFVPVLRPMMAVGIVEGALNLRRLDPKALVPARSGDGFEQELRQFAGSGSAGLGGRAALYLKGKVRGDYLMTLGYDSDKQGGDGLFRDIQPDAFYPVYGDSSVRGFDAQSTGKLYVRIEKDKSWLLYGDYTTQSTNPARQLGAYQRSLNGVQQHYEDGGVVANAFASHDSTRQAQDEIRADGTSGPFALAGADVVANSEKVEILVRDRNQPALVLSATPMTRFTDYDFDALSGRLLFRAPIASLDSHLNPVSIRVTYEVDQGGAAFWVAGADAQVQLGEAVNVGGSFVKDLNPLEPVTLGSFNTTVKLAEATQVVGEVARVERELAGAGNAERVELQHAGTDLKARVYVARSDAGFVNTSATISSGRGESGAKISYALDERTRLTADALHTGDVVGGSRRNGALLGVERSLAGGTKLEFGLRRVHEVSAALGPGAADTTSLRAKVTTGVPGLPLASVFVEAEQDVRDHDKRLLALGGEYRIADQGRLYARHELISSLSGPYALDATQQRNTTVVGIDAEVMKEGRLFSEYRGRDAFDGRETEAAIGLRNRWTVAEGLRLNTSFERVQVLTGTSQDPATAVTGAIEYTADPLWKGTARLELRDGLASRSLLSTLGLARKLDADWTFLGKNILAVTQDKTGDRPGRQQERLQLGVAYRDSATHRINALGRYEFRQERGSVGDEGARSVHIVSTHADYQPRRELTLTAHAAAKWVMETLDGQPARSAAQLVSARASRDLGEKWDVGVAASVLASGGLGSRRTALGAELGYQVQKNLWASIGYNLDGFHDRDLSSENFTNRGVYMRMRFKFDESLFSGRAS